MSILTMLLARLREPSTWAAVAAIAVGFGLITPEQQAQFNTAIPVVIQQASLIVGAVASLAGVVLSETK